MALLEDYSAAKRRAIEASQSIDGWLTGKEAGALFDAAYSAKGPIVEIGSWQGRSTAALALGAMAGSGQTVFAVDSFQGVLVDDRPTAAGAKPGPQSSTPETLRANLERVGVNGLLKIVPADSLFAAQFIPPCGVLFVDGSHDYPSVKADLEAYLPKVMNGGTVLLHDVNDLDPGVVKAVDEVLIPDTKNWRLRGRVDSMVLAVRAEQKMHAVALGCPGGSFCWGTVSGLLESSRIHDVRAINNANGWDDFNAIWATALNMFEAGEITHFAMVHSDVAPKPHWLDILIAELEALDLDLVSTAIPIKDNRGLTSSGVGHENERWGAFRRYTMRELMAMPETFSIADTAYPEQYLLHNTGCWACDLRNEAFRQTNADGGLVAIFDFPTRVARKADGRWQHYRESEDWYFSRMIHSLGIKSAITRKVQLCHRGATDFPNNDGWGTLSADEDTRKLWDQSPQLKG